MPRPSGRFILQLGRGAQKARKCLIRNSGSDEGKRYFTGLFLTYHEMSEIEFLRLINTSPTKAYTTPRPQIIRTIRSTEGEKVMKLK